MGTITLTTVYDNKSLYDNLKAAWGFACVLECPDETILFDTGGDGDVLMHNLHALEFDPDQFAKVIISHMDWDHINGLSVVLERNPNIDVYLIHSAKKKTVLDIKEKCRNVIFVDKPQQISTYIYSLGEMEGIRNEQSIALKTSDGIVVITGCAHPGIVNIIEKAASQFPDKPLYLAIGGFHLKSCSKKEVKKIIERMSYLGVQNVSPTHCTGEAAIQQFEEFYGTNYVQGGVGLKLKFEISG